MAASSLLYPFICCISIYTCLFLFFKYQVSLGNSSFYPHIHALPFLHTQWITQIQCFASITLFFIYLPWDKISAVQGWSSCLYLPNDGTTGVYHHDLFSKHQMVLDHYTWVWWRFWIILIPITNLECSYFDKIILTVLLFSSLNMECIKVPIFTLWKLGFFTVRLH